MIRIMTSLALCAVLIPFAAACDLEVPAMPMVGEEAGGNAGGPVPTPDPDAEPPPEPPSGVRGLGMMAVSIGPLGLLIIIGAGLAIYLSARKGRKSG